VTVRLGTFDPVHKSGNVSLSGGDLLAAWSGAGGIFGSIGRNTGKVYFEMVLAATGTVATGANDSGVGIVNFPHDTDTPSGQDTSAAEGYGYGFDGDKYHNTTTGTVMDIGSPDNDDVLQFAIDFDAGKIWIGLNNTWADSGNPSAGTGEQYSSIPSDVFYIHVAVSVFSTSQYHFPVENP